MRIINEDHFPILVVCHGKDKRHWFRRSNMLPNWWFPREDLDANSLRLGFCTAAPRKIRSRVKTVPARGLSSVTWIDTKS